MPQTEKQKAAQKKYTKQWKLNNPDHNKLWQQNNKDKVSIKNKKYQLKKNNK